MLYFLYWGISLKQKRQHPLFPSSFKLLPLPDAGYEKERKRRGQSPDLNKTEKNM